MQADQQRQSAVPKLLAGQPIKAKITVSIIVLFLPLVGLVFSRDGFPFREKNPTTAKDDLFKKLSIERLERKSQAPAFTLTDLDGKTVMLQDFRGKVVFLNFWATWCLPCRLEMPIMEELHKEFSRQGLVVLAINYREGPEEIGAFFNEHQLTFRPLLDQEGKALEFYQAWSLPTTYLINKSGEIVGRVIGYRDWHGGLARAFFRQLLENKA